MQELTNAEKADLMRSQFVCELMYWAPLVVLVLLSLGLIAMKRLPGLPLWAQRLTAPPFYFVSLPIATLLVLAGMVAWTAVVSWLDRALLGWVNNMLLLWMMLTMPLTPLREPPARAFVVDGIFLVAFCATQVVSAYLLWRALGREDRRKRSLSKTGRYFRALLLLSAFAWAFAYSRSTPFWLCEVR
jgi:hypothetical protein